MSHASCSLPTSHQPLATRFSRREKRSAFTLTELLVVIAIIAVLAAMVSVAVVRALDTAKQTRIKLEVDQIDMAMKAYREKYGSFPPCDLRFVQGATNGMAGFNPALVSHIASAFPRYNIANLQNDLLAAGVDQTNFRPDQALVFWLKGFSPDPANPFVAVNGAQITAAVPGTTIAVTPLFDFDKTRLWQVASSAGATPMISPTGGTILPSYYPQGPAPASSSAVPYLYWDSLSYGPLGSNTASTTNAAPNQFNGGSMMSSGSFNATGQTTIFTNAGLAMPYVADTDGDEVLTDRDIYVNLDPVASLTGQLAQIGSYQIISAGLDGKFGSSTVITARLYPTGGVTYDIAGSDDDNVTNFCPKARLGDAKP